MGFSVERRRAAVRVAVVSRCRAAFLRTAVYSRKLCRFFEAIILPMYPHVRNRNFFIGRSRSATARRPCVRSGPYPESFSGGGMPGCRKHGEPEGGYRRTYEWFFVRERPSVAAIDRDRLSDRKSRSAHSAERLFRLFAGRYSASRISSILIAAVAIGVPGPKIAAAPALYRSS